jgi:thiamine-phosphate pyrophosphorylase
VPLPEADVRDALAHARLYLVCGPLPDERLRAALAGGVEIVQLRMKRAEDWQVIDAAHRYAAICEEAGVPLILNDRPDLVACAGADGVHVGQDDMPVAEARAIVGGERIIGLSTHTPAQVDAANEQAVDYIGVGPVHATPTKPGRPATGLELVRYAAARARAPFFAIGGLDAARIDAVIDAGAQRVAVLRAVADAQNPELAARALRDAIGRWIGVSHG